MPHTLRAHTQTHTHTYKNRVRILSPSLRASKSKLMTTIQPTRVLKCIYTLSSKSSKKKCRKYTTSCHRPTESDLANRSLKRFLKVFYKNTTE